LKNAKTTVLGIATILTAIGSAVVALIDGDPATAFDIAAVVAACTAGLGLIMAKDAEKKAV
jgi:hypothetical protein